MTDKSKNFFWHEIERQELPSILNFGKPPFKRIGGRPDFHGNYEAYLAVEKGYENYDCFEPSFLIVGKSSKELFSWVSTYADDTFPLSQFCRVISERDWLFINNEVNKDIKNTTLWSSIILGELLGQLGLDNESSASLSRTSACLSYAFARGAILYPDIKDIQINCFNRIEQIEKQFHFNQRNLNTKKLKDIWFWALSLQESKLSFVKAIDDLLEIMEAFSPVAYSKIEKCKLLYSDFAEDRVQGFDEIANGLLGVDFGSKDRQDEAALMIAAAAILVGRGTSHFRLLAPVSKLLPEALVWYGFFAGLLGSKFWDKSWAQQARGVDRILRQPFNLGDPVLADICWVEYEWLFNTYNSVEMLTQLTRSFPGGLIIEVIPGVTCQFRFAEGIVKGNKYNGDSISLNNYENHRKDAFYNELSQAANFLSMAQDLISKINSPAQTDFFNNNLSRKDYSSKKSKRIIKD